MGGHTCDVAPHSLFMNGKKYCIRLQNEMNLICMLSILNVLCVYTYWGVPMGFDHIFLLGWSISMFIYKWKLRKEVEYVKSDMSRIHDVKYSLYNVCNYWLIVYKNTAKRLSTLFLIHWRRISNVSPLCCAHVQVLVLSAELCHLYCFPSGLLTPLYFFMHYTALPFLQ